MIKTKGGLKNLKSKLISIPKKVYLLGWILKFIHARLDNSFIDAEHDEERKKLKEWFGQNQS